MKVKARIVDPSGFLSLWNDSSHFCDWDGVTCGRKHRRVTVLNLSSKNLFRVVPPHIGNLSFPRGVHLENNSFHAKIPPHFGRLLRLQELFLNNNSFNGEIPSNLSYCSNLLILNLGYNMLKGNLQTELGSLSKLQGLILQANGLMGNIPPSIRNLSSLQRFKITLNNFGGTIPETPGQLRNLKVLYLGGNKFVGTIPISIFNISALAHLDVGDNQLEGGLPGDLGFTLPNIKSISMWHNHLTGPIPESISNASNLEIIQIDQNNFTRKDLQMWGNNISGNILSEIGKLNKLRYLDLGHNELSGQILESFGNLRMLIQLALHSNNFWGSIPSSLKNCQNLLLLDLSTNNLNGHIPPEIMGISLTGPIPEEVGKLQHLGELHLNGNRLSQQIPSSIGSCISMESLYVQDNFFEGPLSSIMSSMRGLQVLNVSNNQLSGQIPKFLESLNLTNLSLSYNDFEGLGRDTLPTGGVFRSVTSTSVVGNKKLCRGLPNFQLPKCYYKESKRARISGIAKILISTISALVGVACILSLLYFFWFRHNKNALASSSSEDGLLHVSYHNLLKATGGFSSTNLLGILDLIRDGASKSFIAECEVLRRIRHRNLVKVLTACSEFDFNGNDFKALVYEFMSNGSLDEWLHPTASQYTERNKLSLLERVNIAIDVACALYYLHHHYEMPIVHCDLKPSNVLLDDEMNGHVGDFGLARFLPEATHKLLADQSSFVGVKGSFGYVAPKYGVGSAVSTEGDVYSFGVLVLEMFTGKRPIDDMFENGLDLHRFMKATLADRVEKAIDPILL
ncbi:hypothetical protein EUGRSUZ_L00223 [Eucalyptus grandis]|uniref:non-specific serine/threonine protein kinase n=3 Tax=Eucalyptus grandis TaxID=71139 RepID=A0AAD9WJE2_EUCGR|nr:hypothetical protein EUGRSUZ_L00223 [Eucalyptus grandis]